MALSGLFRFLESLARAELTTFAGVVNTATLCFIGLIILSRELSWTDVVAGIVAHYTGSTPTHFEKPSDGLTLVYVLVLLVTAYACIDRLLRHDLAKKRKSKG